jgi:hypothetical protein
VVARRDAVRASDQAASVRSGERDAARRAHRDRAADGSFSRHRAIACSTARALAPFADDQARACLERIERVSAGVASATVVAVPRPAPDDEPRSQVATKEVAADATPPSSEVASGTRVRASPSTDRFRRQHEELHTLGVEIATKLRKKTLAQDAPLVRRLVARFAGKLAVHASMENEALYPRLLAHRDPAVRDSARALFDEVGSIYDAFGAYTRRWPTSASIEADVAGFADETRALLMTLATRMLRENDELYPLVDASEQL